MNDNPKLPIIFESKEMAQARELAIQHLNMTDREFDTLKGKYALMCQLLYCARIGNKS